MTSRSFKRHNPNLVLTWCLKCECVIDSNYITLNKPANLVVTVTSYHQARTKKTPAQARPTIIQEHEMTGSLIEKYRRKYDSVLMENCGPTTGQEENQASVSESNVNESPGGAIFVFRCITSKLFHLLNRLDPSYQTSKKREFDRLEKIWQFYQPSSCLSKKKRLFYLILRGKTLFLFFFWNRKCFAS